MQVHKLSTVAEEPKGEALKAPMVYVVEDQTWEYKDLVRRLPDERALTEEELNALGAKGWELVGIITHGAATHFYFKRPGR